MTVGNENEIESSSSVQEPIEVQEAIDIKCLPAEQIVCSEKDVQYVSPFGPIPGSIVITTYRLNFYVDDQDHKFYNLKLDVPLGHVSKVEKIGAKTLSTSDESYGILIICRDLRTFKFTLSHQLHGRKTLCESIAKSAFPISRNLPMFAFEYGDEAPKPFINGWEVYTFEKEYGRLGVLNSKLWTVMENNLKYKYCDTYPRKFLIPTESAEKGKPFLAKIAEYRSRQRIPVLSWIHPKTGASITRSAQPMPGISSRRCVEDEAHLTSIMNANGNCHKLYIFDARPAVNAKVNRAKGGGYEENYDDAELEFLDIQNIHFVRDSLRRLMSILVPVVSERGFWKQLEETKWLHLTQSILEGSLRVAHTVGNQLQSVLVHCSDGWDRTAQLTSLALMQLDEYHRTIEGFIVLIEKEWCSFGHKFMQRCGHGDEKSHTDSERSPIFVQFMDCVWQFMHQSPTVFEFTPEMLILILDEMYSCRFGTFLYNSEKIRMVDHECGTKTQSLWSLVLEQEDRFYNPMYRRVREPVYVNTTFCQLRVWTEYFGRSNPYIITPKTDDIQLFSMKCPSDKDVFLDELRSLEPEKAE